MFADQSGPKDLASLGKKRYVALYIRDCYRSLRLHFYVHTDYVAWALERFLAEASLHRETEIIRRYCGGDFERCFAEVCARQQIKREG